MKKNVTKKLLGATMLASTLLVNVAQAHIYWIEPNEFFFYSKTKMQDDKVTEQLAWEFTGSDTYFNADVNRAYGEVDEYRFRLITPSLVSRMPSLAVNGKIRAVFEGKVDEKGTYIIEATLTGKPQYWVKFKDGEWLQRGKTQLSEKQLEKAVSHGAYYQHVKSYVSLHTTTNSWEKPLGHPLEIVPLSHPNKVTQGESLSFKVLYFGQPLANAKVKVLHQGFRMKEHGDEPEFVMTNAQGVATAKFDDVSRYLLATEHTSDLAGDKDATFQNHRSSLMLEVSDAWVKDYSEQ